MIVPKATLDSWGVGEGDRLDLGPHGIRPPAPVGLSHRALDELKRAIALAVVRAFGPREIRAQILANLHHWKRSGVWVSAYDEWQSIAGRQSDGELFAAMLGRDEFSTRLRQSAPYVGLLPSDEIRRLNEEASR